MVTEPRTLISVLTPSLNQARWLGANLASVRSQTYRYVEHIVVDGGSDDGSLSLLEQAPGVVPLTEPGSGQSEAINSAFHRSRGEIIGWLNSDDAFYSVDTLKWVAKEFESRPDVDVVYGHAVLVNSADRILQMIWAPPFSRRLFTVHNFIIQPTAFVRRSAIVSADLVRNEYLSAMDTELWLRLSKDHVFHRIDRILAVDRHHTGRKSLLRPDLAAIDRIALAAEYGVPVKPSHMRARRKGVKIAFRWLGIRLIALDMRNRDAWSWKRDSVFRLLARQVASRRGRMPTTAP